MGLNCHKHRLLGILRGYYKYWESECVRTCTFIPVQYCLQHPNCSAHLTPTSVMECVDTGPPSSPPDIQIMASSDTWGKYCGARARTSLTASGLSDATHMPLMSFAPSPPSFSRPSRYSTAADKYSWDAKNSKFGSTGLHVECHNAFQVCRVHFGRHRAHNSPRMTFAKPRSL